MFLRPEVQSHFHFLMSPLFLECQSEACQASPHLLWSRSVFPCCQFWTIPHKSASSNSSPSNARKEAIFCYSHSITSFKRSRVDSIVASLFENNRLSWQIVSEDKILITLLILGRGALFNPGVNLLLSIAESWMWAFNWEMDTSKDSCATQISHLSILATFTATASEWPRLNT